jgi:hypothetical protein
VPRLIALLCTAAASAWLPCRLAGEGRVRVAEERLIAERKLPQPLPSLGLGTPSVLRKVDRLSCMRYGSARYSVPAG